MSTLQSITNDETSVQNLNDSLVDLDSIEVEDLLTTATRLFEEVYGQRSAAAALNTSTYSPREDAMQEVQKFLTSIRQSEVEDEDVVFVEARPGNAPPASARTTAVVDLCTPGSPDECAQRVQPRRRQRRTNNIAPVSFPEFEDASSGVKRARRKPKPEPVDTQIAQVIDISSPANSSIQAFSDTNSRTPNTSGTSSALTCAVCMDNMLNRQPTSTACGHIFCKACIDHAIRLTHKCPLCNKKLNKNKVHRVYF